MLLYITHTLNFLLMMMLPVALVLFLRLKFGTPWRIFIWGAAAFIGSQVLRIPLLAVLTIGFQQGWLPHIPEQYVTVFNLVFLSLTAGIFEEGARYIVYRRFLTEDRTWKDGVSFGAGHGGMESFLLGLVTTFTVIQFFGLKDTDLSTLPLTAEQAALLSQQLTTFWAAPWYLTLLGAAERVFAMTFHISAAVLVLQAFRRHNIGWLFAAIGWHTTINLCTGLLPVIGPLATEGVIGVCALISLWIIFRLRDAATPPTPDTTPSASPA